MLLLVGGGYLLAGHLDKDEGQTEPEGEVKIQIVNSLHAKVYSRDGGEELVFGSPNLTTSGMKGNLEIVSEPRDLSEDARGEMYA